MSHPIQWCRQAFPPASKWHPEDIPDLSGQIVLVTGGNSGIGFEMIKSLLRKNAKVYLAARSQQKGEEAIRALKEDTGKTAEFLQLDLNDLVAVQRSAQDFAQRESHIDILFINAGIMYPPLDQITAQKYDATFGVNVIGHHLFLRLLYPLLTSPSPLSQSQTSPSRIIWTSSSANLLVNGRLDFSTFTEGPDRRKAGTFDLYGQSKLAQIQLSAYVAKRAAEAGENVVSIAVDPGHIRSDIFRGKKPWYIILYEKFVMYPVSYGVLTPLYAGTAPEALEYNGKYIRPWARPGQPHPSAYDREQQEKLWVWLEEQVKEYL
ncbi:NAD(P)-binding protein [Dichomitus squalens LYAD-421 SS1]|uniref:NAD(P)-binding protein n=1 Tax=Dichomitus squalens (strain LYAD-421) TaxID=732165 RepID=R7SWX7_DICSQ|nr:NAD(P)-binding protein [Dichomitus squalens LYAD-421 SS1]EJF60473.1 NAD(P)-binding protein [Dichomitus squalens LYAD-421 SS1]